MSEEVRFDHLKEWEKELNKCSTCGYCTYWCPIYQEDPREESVTRGKIAILKNLMMGKVKFTEETAEILERCLMCGTCLEHCTEKVEAPAVFLQGRRDLAKQKGIKFHTTSSTNTFCRDAGSLETLSRLLPGSKESFCPRPKGH